MQKILEGKSSKKIENKVKVSGRMLLGTIATLDFLGKVGKLVLNKYGIKKIDPEKYYPYELRSAIHKAALDQFGEIALVVSGYTAGELYKDVEKPVATVYKKVKLDLKSSSWRINRRAIEEIFKTLRDHSRNFLANSVKDESGQLNYGYDYKCLGVRKFRFTAAMPQEIYQEPYYRGINDYYFSKYFGKFFEIVVKFKKKTSRSSYGWTELSWDILFHRKLSDLKEEKIASIRKNFLKEELMQSLLKKLEKQNNRLENISHKLGKYLPPQIHDSLFSGRFDDEITTRRRKLTIFFSDIANFTSTSETLQPEDLTKYLNEYFSEMTSIALHQGATIDKYIGDAMMVFFGDPDSKGERNDARACVEMALKMQERMIELQEKWRVEGFADPFEVRMGLNTGYCNVGNFGSEQRLTYTIIGGEVNVAQRLEASADSNGILMSYETYAHASDMIDVEKRASIEMKGISREVKVFSVKNRKGVNKVNVRKLKKEPTMKEFSNIDQLNKDMKLIKSNYEKLNKKIDLVFEKLKK